VSAPIVFVSSNPRKHVEAQRILGIPLVQAAIPLPEIQAATVEEITRYKLEVARSRGHERLIVEDVSLGFTELGEFPGPYVKWLLEAAGGKGLAAIAWSLRDRSAVARCCVGYWDGESVAIFNGEAGGEIVVEPRGDTVFGWDPWFQPSGSSTTFAEMADAEKDACSHRGHAYRLLRGHLATVATD
jgi:non-canonical purine NTP pyrophosphatase (RdgB/HAM1 family)